MLESCSINWRRSFSVSRSPHANTCSCRYCCNFCRNSAGTVINPSCQTYAWLRVADERSCARLRLVAKLKCKTQSIISQLHMGRQHAIDRFMLQLMAHVRQVGALRLELANDIERLLQAEVSGVRLETQGIKHQDAQPFQARPALARDLADIRTISYISYPKSQHIEMGVDQRDGRHLLAEDVERLRTDALEDELGDHASGERIGFWTEGVGRDGTNPTLDFGSAVERDWPAQQARQWPKVVESEQVVRVIVREQHGMDEADTLAEQLQTQLRRRIDKQIALLGTNEHGAAIAMIARIGRLADRAVTADHGHAHRRARAKKGERSRLCHHALNRDSWLAGFSVILAKGTVALRGGYRCCQTSGNGVPRPCRCTAANGATVTWPP